MTGDDHETHAPAEGEEFRRSGQRRLGIAVTGFFLMLYAVAYVRAFDALGPNAAHFLLVPVLAAAWFLGWRGALLAGLVSAPLQYGLDSVTGDAGAATVSAVLLATSLGVLAGYVRDTRVRLQELTTDETKRLQEQGWLRSTIEADMRRHAEQVQLLADLGRRALQGEDARDLMQRAVDCASRGLGTDYGDLLEYQEPTQSFVFRGVYGTNEDLVGRVIEAGRGSHSGYTLLVGQPVIVEDYSNDARFHMPIPTRRHRIVSGLSAIVGDPFGRPFGVMAVYTKTKRRFTDEDLAYLQAIANTVGLAMGGRARSGAVAKQGEASELETRW
jgi:hypothetical protein